MPQAEIVYRYILAGIGVIVVGFVFCWLVYISYKRDKDIPKKERPTDPFIKSFVMALAVVFLIAFVNFFEPGFFKRYWWVGLIVLICALSFYWVMLKKRLPLDVYQQYDLCLEIIDYFFKAKLYKGRIDYLPLDACRTTQEPGRPNVANWLITAKTTKKIDFYLQIDKESKEILTIMPRPSSITRDKLMEKTFPKPPRPIPEAFGEEESEEEAAAEAEERGM